MLPRFLSLLVLVAFILFVDGSEGTSPKDKFERAFPDNNSNGSATGHTNNWAVLVCSSRYWFNYRHMANALGMYRSVKRLGIPDSNIILMLADDASCNARNKFPGSVYANPGRVLDLYGDNIEVDYRGYDVTVENFIRVLTGRVPPTYPRSKRLLTDDRSNILVYMTGHGGDEFLKFQDQEELSAFDLADAFEQMWQKKRYHQMFFMIDTCQANTMFTKIYSPNILATGSSVLGENSYSYEVDYDIGVSVIDSYTHYILEFLEGINKTSKITMDDLFATYDPQKIRSHPGVRSDLFPKSLKETLVADFFGGVAEVEPSKSELVDAYPFGEHGADVEARKQPDLPTSIRAQEITNRTKSTRVVNASILERSRVWAGVSFLGALIGIVLFQSQKGARTSDLLG